MGLKQECSSQTQTKEGGQKDVLHKECQHKKSLPFSGKNVYLPWPSPPQGEMDRPNQGFSCRTKELHWLVKLVGVGKSFQAIIALNLQYVFKHFSLAITDKQINLFAGDCIRPDKK